jgi:hypothetical protein
MAAVDTTQNNQRGTLAVRLENGSDRRSLSGVRLSLTIDSLPPMRVGAVLSNASGVASFTRAAGMYFLHADMIGYRGGKARVFLRAGFSDSIIVQLHQIPLCD